MEDWTDIFAEELKEVEETLPADDWAVIQQKYAAVKRRRRIILWSAVAGVAAVLTVFAVLFAGDPGSELPLVADKEIVRTVQPEAEPEIPVVEDSVMDAKPLPKPSLKRVTVPQKKLKPLEDDLVAESDGVVDIEVVRDTLVSHMGVLIADNHQDKSAQEQTSDEKTDAALSDLEQGEWIEGKEQEILRPKRRRIAVGVSGGSAFAGGSVMVFDNVASDMAPPMDPSPMDPPMDGSLEPSDTSSLGQNALCARLCSAAPMPATRSDRTLLSEAYDHNMPVSYGVSARFTLTKRFSLNTGLNYTLYTSRRTRKYSDGSVENDRQSVHYLGIPLRADWMLIDRPRFGMYIGAGAQIDRCVYAKVGNERLYDDGFLWSLGGALGFQYNITPLVSLYAEPELTANFGYSRIQTHRDDAPFMMSARFGLRVNL